VPYTKLYNNGKVLILNSEIFNESNYPRDRKSKLLLYYIVDATLEDLVRLWMHEGLRLFQDRLVTAEEKKWTDQKIDSIALKHFPNVNPVALKRPILFSNWLSREYRPIEQEKLREYIKARLKVSKTSQSIFLF
jgi:hypothetical protein